MKYFFIILISSLLLTSCIALHNGNIYPSVTLEKNNFAYIETVSASATAKYILGIGGNRAGLVESSLNSFRRKLKNNQALVNITIDERKTWFILPLLFQEKKVTISADIIEFTKEGQFSKITKNEIKNNDEEIITRNDFEFIVGEFYRIKVKDMLRKVKFINFLENGEKAKVKLVYNNKTLIVDTDEISR